MPVAVSAMSAVRIMYTVVFLPNMLSKKVHPWMSLVPAVTVVGCMESIPAWTKSMRQTFTSKRKKWRAWHATRPRRCTRIREKSPPASLLNKGPHVSNATPKCRRKILLMKRIDCMSKNWPARCAMLRKTKIASHATSEQTKRDCLTINARRRPCCLRSVWIH